MTDFVRWINIVAALILLGFMIAQALRNWHRYTTRARDVWWATFGWVLLLLYGTAEVLYDWGVVRVYFGTFVLLVNYRAVLSKEHYFTDQDRPDA